jgi:hypothetical protein
MPVDMSEKNPMELHKRENKEREKGSDLLFSILMSFFLDNTSPSKRQLRNQVKQETGKKD